MYKVTGNGYEIEVEKERLISLAGFLYICNTASSKDFTLDSAIDYLKENKINVERI